MKGLQLNHLSYDYRGQPLFSDLNAHFAPSKIFALAGVNGSGKSTLLRVLAGLNQPQKGEVLFEGQSLYQPHSQLSIGYLPPSPCLYPHMTVLENMVWLSRLQRCQAPFAHAWQFMVQHDIASFKNKLFGKLSDGQKKWIHLLATYLNSPKLMIFDEPCSSLDPTQRSALWALLKRWQAPDNVILFSTHHVSEAAKVVDDLVFLQDGQLYFENSANTVNTEVPCL